MKVIWLLCVGVGLAYAAEAAPKRHLALDVRLVEINGQETLRVSLTNVSGRPLNLYPLSRAYQVTFQARNSSGRPIYPSSQMVSDPQVSEQNVISHPPRATHLTDFAWRSVWRDRPDGDFTLRAHYDSSIAAAQSAERHWKRRVFNYQVSSAWLKVRVVNRKPTPP